MTHRAWCYAAYGWLLVGALLHFGIDVLAQYARGHRAPGPETTLYYGVHSAYALGQVLFAALGLVALRGGGAAVGRGPGLLVGFGAALAWLAVAVLFLGYWQPRMVVALFAALLAGAALAA